LNNIRCIATQKEGDFIYTAEEACKLDGGYNVSWS